MFDVPPPLPLFECVEALAPDATAVVALTGRRQDLEAFLRLRPGAPAGGTVEAQGFTDNGYGFVRYRFPATLGWRGLGGIYRLAGRLRLTASEPAVDPPICPLPGEDEEDAANPVQAAGWAVSPSASAAPEPDAQFLLHGPAARLDEALEAARRFGWNIVSRASGGEGDAFALIVQRGGGTTGLEVRLFAALARLGVATGFILPLDTRPPDE